MYFSSGATIELTPSVSRTRQFVSDSSDRSKSKNLRHFRAYLEEILLKEDGIFNCVKQLREEKSAGKGIENENKSANAKQCREMRRSPSSTTMYTKI